MIIFKMLSPRYSDNHKMLLDLIEGLELDIRVESENGYLHDYPNRKRLEDQLAWFHYIEGAINDNI